MENKDTDPVTPPSTGFNTPYAGSLESIHDREAWRAQYRATVEALECIRAQELKGMTEERARRIMASLNVCETPWRENREWSGLVEQQAIFHRKRKP